MPMPTLISLTLRLAAERPDLQDALVGVLGERSLQGRVLRLASEREDLRPVLLDLLGKTANTSVIQQAPIVIQQAPIVVQNGETTSQPDVPMFVQQPAAPAPAAEKPVPMGLINDRTRNGFDSDIKPELERLAATGQTREQAANEMISQVNDAFKQKTYLYNVLIRHQSTFETDDVFRDGLIKAIQVWVSEGLTTASGRR